MNLSIPLYVEERRVASMPTPTFVVRPLFFEQPVRQADLLSRATTKLVGDLRQLLEQLGKSMRHDELARWTFAPDVAEHHVAVPLELRRSRPTFRSLVLAFDALDRRVAFAPALPQLSFEVTKGQRVEERAAEVYSAYFRRLERESKEFALPPHLSTERPRSWVTSVDVDVQPRQEWPQPVPPILMLGGGGSGSEQVSGRAELEKVGRCLDRLYPDELERAILRDAEVAEVSRRLGDVDKRPVLLVGRPRVGKTAIVHEHVFRDVRDRGLLPSGKGGVWLIGPQRLISGMSYVGQWENRLLAILREARRRERVLYFDDLLGLFAAGITSQSDLSVAHVLRPFVERRDVRVLAEITPEALRVLRERDRGFADLFHVLPVPEPSDREARRVVIEVARQLEGRQRCAFTPDALPAAIDVQRRYVRDLAMPGKVAGFLRQLATKYANRDVRRATVIEEFHARSGLSLAMLDDHQRLVRAEVVEALGTQLIGQPAAVDAMADAVCVAKARLNDPGRPLASMLFLGPTGVGKTQAAKALAQYLFGDAERLLRFDMNEYLDGYSASRLVGTFGQPDGLLTSAVRRQPFCVVLLDEIEKAHPAVFDLLLQVLGEGRLTDAHGRPADFTNAVVLLTSNLGVRESAASFGLRPSRDDRGDEGFTAAAEAFFRPEFFNRLDRVVPFRALSRDDVSGIARGLIRGVFEREGLLSRRCVLRLEPRAMERIVDDGFHPQLGARALKRAIERQLTRPVANTLATIAPGTPTVIDVVVAGGQLSVHTQPLEQAEAEPPVQPDLSDAEEAMERVLEAVARIEAAQAAAAAPKVLTQGELGSEQFRRLAVGDQAGRVRRAVQRAFDRLDAPRPSAARRVGQSRVAARQSFKPLARTEAPPRAIFAALMAADDVNQYLADLAGTATEPGGEEASVRNAVSEAALLEAMADADAGDRVILHLRPLSGEGEDRRLPTLALVDAYGRLFDRHYGFTCEVVRDEAGQPLVSDGSELVLLEFPGAATLLAREVGTHLFTGPRPGLSVVQVMAVPVASDADPREVAAAHLAQHERWRGELAAGRAKVTDDPWPVRPVVRVYDGHAVVVDLMTGLVARGGKGLPTPHDLRSFIVGRLPAPPELTE